MTTPSPTTVSATGQPCESVLADYLPRHWKQRCRWARLWPLWRTIIQGIKGANATTAAIFLAKSGASKDAIRSHIVENYYPLSFTIDAIRPDYGFNETCQDTVPQAIEAFLESESFEDAIRTAISVGGDSDTLAAITGSIAEAYYGIPKDLYDTAITYLDEPLKQILFAFESVFGSNLQAEWIFFHVELRFQKTDAENRNLHRLFCRNGRIFAKTL